MKKLISLALILYFSISLNIYAQIKPSLMVLPLNNTEGDEETLSILLANHESLRDNFTIIPATSTFDAIRASEEKTFEADLVITVNTQTVWSANIALISLINAKTLQLLSGDYRYYQTISELRSHLPEITENLLDGIPRDGTTAPKMSIMPVYTALDQAEAAMLAQIISIEIANSGRYSVFPWDIPESDDPKTSYFGIIDPEVMKELGERTDSQYILTGDILSMGTSNLFRTGIVKVEEGNFIGTGDVEYRNIAGELQYFQRLAKQLLHIEVAQVEESPQPYIAREELINLVRIESGTFIMGSPLSEVSRRTDEIQHQVSVESFYMGKYLVTQTEYTNLMGTNPSHFKGENLPVEMVTWLEAIMYCNALSEKEGLTPVYTITDEEIIWNHSANGYRLPTEAEWEYAARAGTTTAFYFGDNINPNLANYDGNYPYNGAPTGLFRTTTTPVGAFPPNAWGLYDMHGNVYEWCWNQYEPYEVDGTSGMNGSMLERAVMRGGSWYSEARFLRSAFRGRMRHENKHNYIGFRVVRSIF